MSGVTLDPIVSMADPTLIIPVYIPVGSPDIPAIPFECGDCWRAWVLTVSSYKQGWNPVESGFGSMNSCFTDFESANAAGQAAANAAADAAQASPDEGIDLVGWTVVKDVPFDSPACSLNNSGCPPGEAYDSTREGCFPHCPAGFSFDGIINCCSIALGCQPPALPPTGCTTCDCGPGEYSPSSGACAAGDTEDFNNECAGPGFCPCCIPNFASCQPPFVANPDGSGCYCPCAVNKVIV